MPISTTFLFQWFVAWVILSVTFYFAAEQIQRYLYETTIEKMPWRVLAVTPILAAVLVKCPLPFQELFFHFTWTLLQAMLWFVACWLGLRFHWTHAAATGLIAVVTIAPMASSSVDALSKRLGFTEIAAAKPDKPVTPRSVDSPAARPTDNSTAPP